MVICLERDADLPLPLTVSCFSKIHIGFAVLVPAHPGSPGKRAVKRVRVCVCVVLCWLMLHSCCDQPFRRVHTAPNTHTDCNAMQVMRRPGASKTYARSWRRVPAVLAGPALHRRRSTSSPSAAESGSS